MAANYYDVLNVTKDADVKAISEAYKKMALKWHPDKNPDNVEEANRQFQQISQAYQVLSDTTKRLKYDRGQTAMDHDAFFCYDDDDDDEDHEFGFFINPEMLFRHFFQNFLHRPFHAYNFYRDQRHNGRQRSRKSEENRRSEKREKKSENHGEETCQIRMVNGKQWMTKTYYEDGNKIVTRYEEGELISKQVNGVFQKIQK